MKAKVFIGSSVEGLRIAKGIGKVLSQSVDVVLWTSEPVFTAGETTVESLARVVPEFDLAIMVWTRDDTVSSRRITSEVPRDNVILEYGYFSAALGRTRCLIVADHGIKVPTDTSGITFVQIERSGKSDNVTPGDISKMAAKISLAIEREGLHPSRELLAAFSRDQLIDIDPEVSRILGLGIQGLSAVTEIRDSLGLHLWILVGTASGPRMRRCGRQRLNDNPTPNNWGDFDFGKGIPGFIWSTGSPVSINLTKDPYKSIKSAHEWKLIDSAKRFGSTWTMYSRSRSMFSALAGVPLTDRSTKVVGALTANCGRSVGDPQGLASDQARNWLEEVASVAWDALPTALAASAELLASIER